MVDVIAKRKRDESLLQDDVDQISFDTPFPRGGGSLISPLEIRKAAAEATSDVFDQMQKQKKQKRNKQKATAESSSQPKIEPLVLSKIRVGTFILGQITEIRFSSRELVISLPNNLTGYCLTDSLRVEQIGRFLRFVVTGVGEAPQRKLELSYEPELVNQSIDPEELLSGLAVQGIVSSIQEKGLVVSLGETLGEGFVAAKNADLLVGEPVLTFVVNGEKRIKSLCIDPTKTVATVMSQPNLVPGTLVVSAPLERETPMGCVYDLLGQFPATSDVIHSQGEGSAVRIIFSYPPLQINGERQIGVSRLDHLVTLQTLKPTLKIGAVLNGTVLHVRPNLGLFLNVNGTSGFAHISQISAEKVDLEDEKYAASTKHQVRVVSLPRLDGIPYLSLDPEVIAQKYMSASDISIGDVISNGVVDRIMPKGGVLVKLSKGIVGIANENQLSDYTMKNPELRFKVGQRIRARVLNVDLERERVELSLKKSIVEFDGPIILSYNKFTGVTVGTVIQIMDFGAKISFFGGVKGLLPASQMSEAGVNPSDLLKLGQTVKVWILEADAARDRLIVSSRPRSDLDKHVGKVMKARISSCTKHEVRAVLGTNGALGEATLLGSPKNVKVDDEIEVKVLNNGLVTNDKALMETDLPCSVDDLEVGQRLRGFVCGQKETVGLFIGFAAGLVGLVPANLLGKSSWPAVNSVVKVLVDTVDFARQRVFLSLPSKSPTINATITAVKDTQLNVVTNDGQQGRVDISHVFKNMEEIQDQKHPLSSFKTGQVLENLAIIGRHDARNHRFLPISHRSGTHIVLELSLNTPEDFHTGKQALAFINNYSEDKSTLWVTLSPNNRGQLSLIDLSKDPEVLASPEKHFPVGSAITVTILKSGSKLALTALHDEQSDLAQIFSIDPLKLMVRLPYHRTASVACVDTGDKFKKLKRTFNVGDIVQFKRDQGRVTFRKDPHEPIQEGQVRDGFVINIANGGVFVSLAPDKIGRVQIGQLSDTYLKDWKSFLKIGDVVKAKVLSVTKSKIELSLKPSVVTGLKQPNIDKVEVGRKYTGIVRRVERFGVFVDFKGVTGLCHQSEISDHIIDDLSRVFKVGDSVKVKVLAKDEAAGKLSLGMKAVYFDGDDSSDVSSEDEDEKTSDSELEADSDSDFEIEVGNGNLRSLPDNSDIDIDSDSDFESDNNSNSDSETASSSDKPGLSASFDWSGDLSNVFKHYDVNSDSDSSSDDEPRSKPRRKRETIVSDDTAKLQTRLPQSAKDFERLLVSSPESSILWMNYMAFKLQLGEIDSARSIAKRALKTIPQRQEEERLNIWIALLNLEVQFGSDESVDQVFKDAQQFMDSLTIHLRMANIFAKAGKIQKAKETFKMTRRRFGSESLEPWLKEMRFLFTDGVDKVASRALADSAIQRLPKRLHRDFTKQFALMEFELGDPERGRTLFEALLSASPKKVDLWSVYIDQEIKLGDESKYSALFERVLEQHISMKQAKFFFKKWIEVASDQEYVTARAREYVEERDKVGDDDEHTSS